MAGEQATNKGKQIETSDSSNDEAEYKFQVIQFCKHQKKPLNDIEIVPASWLSWVETKGKRVMRYPSPPYNAKICMQLQRLVEAEKYPLNSWPWWEVNIRGGANTYMKALERLEKFRTSAYACTSDTDVDPKELCDITEVQDDGKSKYSDRDAADKKNASVPSSNSEPTASKHFSKKQVRPKNIPKRTVKAREIPDSSLSNEESLRREPIASSSADGNNNRERTACEHTATTNLISEAQLGDADKSTTNFTPDTLVILRELERLRVNLIAATQAIIAAINDLADKPSTTGNVNHMVQSAKTTVEQVDKVNELDLPFESMDKFEAFDSELKEDKDGNQSFISSLKPLLDQTNNVTKSVTNILRKFFRQELVRRFTAKKKMQGKVLLKTTNFGCCLIAVLTNFHTQPDGTPINADMALKATGNIISNAKDWDGRK